MIDTQINFLLQYMQDSQQQNTKKQKIDISSLAQQEGWSDIKKVRAQITLQSIKKAAERVLKEKQAEKKDTIEMEDNFNLALAKEIHFEKVATQYGDANSVTRGVFSPKGDLYVTVGSSGEGKIWNTLNPNSPDFCQEISCMKSPSKICGVDIHPRVGIIPGSAPNIITGSTNGQLLIWSFSRDLQQQKSVMKQAHSERINSVKFMETGSHFLTSSYDHNWSLWDARRLSRLLTQKGHEKQIHTSCLHRDQSLYLTGDLGGFGMVWDLRTGKGIYEIKQNDSLLCSDFHPNGFELAVGGKTNIISIFDLRRKNQLKRIPAHLKLISDLKYQEKGAYLASASHDNTIKLWHGQNYTSLPVDDLEEQHKITSIDIRDGRMAVTGIDRKWSMFINKLRWREE